MSTSEGTALDSSKSRRTWIFQANPNRYRIHDSLRNEQVELWNLNQHIKDVSVGDRVLIWISGDEAGIYAIGTVIAPPVITADSEVGISYWLVAEEGRRAKARVEVRYDHVFLDRPLYKAYLESNPELWNMRILRLPRGTNFAVSEAEWSNIREWLDDYQEGNGEAPW